MPLSVLSLRFSRIENQVLLNAIQFLNQQTNFVGEEKCAPV